MINKNNIRQQLVAEWHGKEISYHELAETLLPEKLGVYLDYGCGSLQLIRRLEGRYDIAHGVDVVPPQGPFPERFRFSRIGTTGKLPFADNTFDSISIIEVIEHVPVESEVLQEIERVLKPGGTMVLTTPHRGLLTWSDPGNWKFDVPTFHRWAHIYLLRNREYYERNFGQQRPDGLIGDVSGGRHKHYAVHELLVFLPPRLTPVNVIVSYPGMRMIWASSIAGRLVRAGALQRLFEFRALRCWLSRRFSVLGDQLALVAQKK